MFHPEAGGIATVPVSSVQAHQSRGWVLNNGGDPSPDDVPDASSDVTTDEPHEENY